MKEHEISQNIELCSPERNLDFQTLKNPWGESQLCQHAEYLCPQPTERLLINHISEWLNVDPDSITLGRNGSTEIINLIPDIFMRQNGVCLVIPPTYFGLFEVLVNSGRQIIEIPAKPETGFAFNDKLLQQIICKSKKVKPSLIWVCSPNNPTGTVMPSDRIKTLSQYNPQSLIVVDEAYHEYIDPANTHSAVRLIDNFPNILVTKTFSKAFGLSEIRIGVAIGNPAIINTINSQNQRPQIEPLYLSKAILALHDLKHLFVTQNKMQVELDWFYKHLSNLPNIEAGAKSETGVIILRHKYQNLWRTLSEIGIKSMDCSNLNGLEDQGYIRIGLQTHELNKKFVHVLRHIN
jgi:histidinol-phosphate aminotransferase